ncbi:hypothetical protein [Massilia antarctica]|nr:hypothetical protein [Massilia sp. H27-R4]
MMTAVLERHAYSHGERCFHAGYLDYARRRGMVIKPWSSAQ